MVEFLPYATRQDIRYPMGSPQERISFVEVESGQWVVWAWDDTMQGANWQFIPSNWIVA